MLYDRSRMRIGDAERSQMAEVLGKHFADGRLDQHEFDERMEKAMAAKTEADLAGLLADLPKLGDQQPPVPQVPARPPRVRRTARFVVLALVGFVLLRSLWWWPWHVASHGLVLVVAILVGIALLRGRRFRSRL
jgi:hypothetical protein